VNCRVLLCGETGTGKEVAARSLHGWSSRASEPFVTINCPAIPETLFESELFGYERGAFSGAVHTHSGRLMEGDRGTVFLDEVSELPLAVQAKLLRVMEQGEIQRLGGRGTQRVDVRWIAATNRDLRAMAQTGTFRADLYYRLAVAETLLPPLRERKEDLPALAEHFAVLAAAELLVTPHGFTSGALQALEAHDWPGNLRELRNAVEIALIRAGASPIAEAHLPAAIVDPRQRDPRDDLERTRILDALEQVHWNKSEAAKRLQWSRMTLYRKLAYHHLAQRNREPEGLKSA
jgi:DNA-binding NtrC family response regulator